MVHLVRQLKIAELLDRRVREELVKAQKIIHRTIAVGLVFNQKGQLLICKMHPERGVFPGQWGFPGGGVEAGERMREALQRELLEEIGIEVTDIQPAFFKDAQYEKAFADGSRREMYMVFLIFRCRAASEDLVLNDEFIEYRWVTQQDLAEMELNCETRDTLERLGPWGEFGSC